ncbi:Cysteine-Rich Protein 2-Binding Protein [Manis pentadactyla]|nr:Cysteine-Rich Protein 2-Binding Protein [Manis pentadactyla]
MMGNKTTTTNIQRRGRVSHLIEKGMKGVSETLVYPLPCLQSTYRIQCMKMCNFTMIKVTQEYLLKNFQDVKSKIIWSLAGTQLSRSPLVKYQSHISGTTFTYFPLGKPCVILPVSELTSCQPSAARNTASEVTWRLQEGKGCILPCVSKLFILFK